MDRDATIAAKLRREAARLATACATATAAACSLAPDPPVVAPVEDIPAAFAGAADPSGRPPASPDPAALQDGLRWWDAFQDPALEAVVDSVLASNFDLAEGVARVRQARAQARIAKAPLLPSVGLSLGAADQNTPANAGLGAQFRQLGLGGSQDSAGSGAPLFDRLAFTTYSASLDFSYELDFWGRARSDARAAAGEYLATESDFLAARIGVVSEAISTYFEIVDLRERVALAREVASVSAERAGLAETRYGRGLVSSFRLYQVRQDLLETQAAVPALETALATAEGRLATLWGGYARDAATVLPDSLAPALPRGAPPPGAPAALLLQRPDVRAAGQRLEAARHRVGARRASLLPSLSLSGSVGYQSAEAGDLFDGRQWFRNLLANLAAPLFMGGRLRGALTVAEAQLDQAVAAFGRAVVTAVHEVEAALARFRNDERRRAFLEAQLVEARTSAELQARRYAGGVAGYADYLDAQRNLLNVRSVLSTARRDVALARLAVHRALGGAWFDPAQDAVAAGAPVQEPAAPSAADREPGP